MIVVAHAGHWLATLIYMVPLIAFFLWLVFIAVRDRMAQREEELEQPQ